MNKYLGYLSFFIILFFNLVLFNWIHSGFDHVSVCIYIVLFSILKILIIGYISLQNIANGSNHDTTFHQFLGMVAIHILIIVCMFSIDYTLVYVFNHQSFEGIPAGVGFLKLYFKMFYLSFMLFTNMGVANVIPVSITAECITMFEAIVSFSTIIFILSDFVSVQKSLQKIKRGT